MKKTPLFRIIAWIIPIVFSVGVAYAMLSSMPDKIEKNSIDISSIKTDISINKTDIAVLKTDIRYIRDGVDEIKRAVKK